jgi:hypothetical protein
VKGISRGEVDIYVRSGPVLQIVHLTVVVPTESISLKESYIVLSPKEKYQIRATVSPKNAERKLTYESTNKKVATVNAKGKVTAKKNGSTSIIVSNGEMMASLTVMVGKQSASASVQNNISLESEDGSGAADATEVSVEEGALAQMVVDAQGRALLVRQSDAMLIDTDTLAALYESGGSLTISAEEYSISIDGKDIQNTAGSLSTYIGFSDMNTVTDFTVNKGNELPGEIELTLADGYAKRPYLYLYNDAREKYELLDRKDGNVLTLDTGGRYRLADEKAGAFPIKREWLYIGGGAVAAIFAVFIIAKRRYWFW